MSRVLRVKCSPDHARVLASRASAIGEFEIACALEILARDVEGYSRALLAHHDMATLSESAIEESIGRDCQICARASGEVAS